MSEQMQNGKVKEEEKENSRSDNIKPVENNDTVSDSANSTDINTCIAETQQNANDNKNWKEKLASKQWKIVGFVSVIAAALLIGIGWYNAPTQRIDRQLALGYKYLEEQQYEEAVIAFSNAIAIDEKCLEAYAGGIEAYKNTDKTEEMQQLYENALSVVRSLDTDVLAQNEKAVNTLYLSADEVYGNDLEKATEILEEGLGLTENSEEVKKELDHLYGQKANVAFMQKVYDLMAAEDYDAMREVAGSEEAVALVTGMQGESYIYIPEDSAGLNGMGAGVYTDDEGDYYFFYGNYVNGERTGQGSSFMKCKEEDNRTYRGINGEYRIFTGEWQNDAPNGFGREELVNVFYTDDYRSGKVISEGNLKDGLWDGDIQFIFFYSTTYEESKFDCSFTATNGVPITATEDNLILGVYGEELYYYVSADEYRAAGLTVPLKNWVDCVIVKGDTIGTIGYGDVHTDETIIWIFGQ